MTIGSRSWSGGGGLAVVLLVALLLGLRHASDPDHLAAVSTLIASNPDDGTRRAGRLGLAWGAGHAVTLAAFGLPIVLMQAYLPDIAQRAAEALVGLMIMFLALRLLGRWRPRWDSSRSCSAAGTRSVRSERFPQAFRRDDGPCCGRRLRGKPGRGDRASTGELGSPS